MASNHHNISDTSSLVPSTVNSLTDSTSNAPPVPQPSQLPSLYSSQPWFEGLVNLARHSQGIPLPNVPPATFEFLRHFGSPAAGVPGPSLPHLNHTPVHPVHPVTGLGAAGGAPTISTGPGTMSTPSGPPSAAALGMTLSPIVPALSSSQVSETSSSTSLRSTLSSGLEAAFSQGLAICSLILQSQREASGVEEVILFLV